MRARRKRAQKTPKKQEHQATIRLVCYASAPVKQHLEALVATGLYGKNAADAAERIIARGLEQLLSDGKLKRHP